MSSVIVVGGGLSGLSAAHTILERGGRVVVVEKMPFLGGNSTKATSGINGALTKTQIKLGIKDSAEKFYEDTAHSARDLLRPELVKVLTYNSASAVEWLQDKFKLDLSLVSQLGGHSFPRTHRGKERFPGMTITYALMEKLEDIAKAEPSKVRVVKKARVTKLLQDANGNVIGVEFDQEGKVGQELGPVILATGGYAADFAPDGLLKQIRPDLIHLPTTNGDWSTGDGIKLTKAIGGNTVDLEKVQVHPTGLVDPNEPDAKVKFLAAEALRGCGGILLDANGKRFADELGHRDYVTGQMWKNKGPFRLILNGLAAKEIEWHCKHYMGRGLMKHFKNGKELAAEMGVSVDVIATTMQQYNGFAKNNNDPFGKKFFHNLPFDINDEFYVSIVTPVLHFTMGGLEIDHEGQVLRANKTPINGLFASGEVCGGVHGANRLGGSSLLGCVVYGRVAGETASKYFFSQLIENPQSTAAKRLGGLSNQLTGNAPITATINHNGIQTTIEVEPDQKRVAFNISWDGRTGQPTISAPTVSAPSVSSAPTAEPTAAPVQQKKGGDKEYTWEEVAKHNSEKDCWVVVNGQVLDVTNFLKDHPGGKKAILLFAGKDATEEFNMLHKPDVVEKYAPESVLGKIKGPAPSHAPAKSASSSGKATQQAQAAPKTTLKMAPSDVESPVSGGTAHVLPQERAKATFDVEKMTNYLDGSAEQTKRRRFIIGVTKNSDHPDKNNWGPVEQLREHVKHFLEIHEPYWDTWTPTREEIVWMSEYSMFQGSMMNHYGLFLPTLTVHASDEQRNWWWKKALSMKMVGCYAQTELGHGSNVRGLRTIAEYDKKTQEFVLNTPTLTAMKWWPGTLGKVATHALVYAQLIIDGKELGVHSFMLQIRDENHKPFPGIEVGDLGPKLGDNANDTGFMRLTNVRIPREFMLARYQQVTPDGQYIKSPEKEKNMKLGYTTMIFTRGAMVKSAGTFLARAATIATRYSCVRKQGFVDTKKATSFKSSERQIIDHQVQRYRVFRQVAMAYAMKFTGSWMTNKFKEMEGTDRTLKNFDLLPEIAATSGGLKALCTYLAWSGIEDCRKCCGGNGYLMASGVAPLAANYVWQTTAEGDWIVLMLQTGMFLMKVLSNVAQGKSTSETFAYLEPLKQGLDISSASAPTASSAADFSNPDFLLSLFRHLALVRVALAGQEFQAKLGELNNFNEAVNATALELCAAVRAHCFCFMLTNFVKAVKHAPDAATKDVLTNVCALFATSTILDDSVWSGVLTSPQVQLAKQATGELLNAIRPNCVALVDAFDIPDRVLGSAIGRYDGNVYEALWESAQRSPLNQKDPFDGYHEYLSPHLDKELLKNPNTVPKM